MDKYEYLKIRPELDTFGDFQDGYESSTEKTKSLFGGEIFFALRIHAQSSKLL